LLMASKSNNIHAQGDMEVDLFIGDDKLDEDPETGLSSKDAYFDTGIGCIEDIIMEEPYQIIQNGF
ncbi:ADP-ribosylation factor-like protein 2-binding protein, partial [Biomphalaria pfeifferi]